MNNSELERILLAVLPAREGRQRHTGLPSLPAVYGLDNVPGTSGGDVLQSTLKEATSEASQSNQQLSSMEALQQEVLKSTGQNIFGLNSTAQTGGGSSALSTLDGLLSGVLGQGSILSPIVSGIMSLFGGGGSSTTTALSSFDMPASVNVETAINQPAGGATGTRTSQSASGVQMGATSQQPIQVQISALDSQSFLDHSNDIASAVRKALLDSHPLNDVIAEL